MPTLELNGNKVEFTQGMTVLQVCELGGVEIPRFCYHERLSIAGNCRMCLVEIKQGPPKPTASCAMPASDGMVVFTDSPMVKKAREGVMEFLLINHPLDCPICDQGGECDLQDQAMAYGRGKNRFHENKRAVADKYMGPLIQTHMTRCIHCTRCVRFITEVAGVPELGTIGRGEHMEVGTYVEKALSSELSGNIIDLCPVGALLSKPYSFKARSWELKHTDSIDVHDAVGSHIRVDSRGKEVMRILPRVSEAVNEEWLADKARFSYDGLKLQRLDRPMVKKRGRLEVVSWDEAINTVKEKLSETAPEAIAALAGDMADVESMVILKEIMQEIGSPHIDCRQDGGSIDATHRASYLFNSTIASIEKADVCLLIGASPRFEAPLVNSRIRKTILQQGLKVASIGDAGDLTYPYNYLGDSIELLKEICDEKSSYFEVLQQAKFPLIILGEALWEREDAETILFYAKKLAEKCGAIKEEWNGLNILHKTAARVGGLDAGFVPQKGGKSTKDIIKAAGKGEISLIYLLGADEIAMNSLGNAFVIYQGHHGDAGAHRADIILPGAAYTEKDATYVNMEGRVQFASRAISPPGDAKEDWRILADIAKHFVPPALYSHFQQGDSVRRYMKEAYPVFAQKLRAENWGEVKEFHDFEESPIVIRRQNYYMTDAISRASKTMAECSSLFNHHTLFEESEVL